MRYLSPKSETKNHLLTHSAVARIHWLNARRCYRIGKMIFTDKRWDLVQKLLRRTLRFQDLLPQVCNLPQLSSDLWYGNHFPVLSQIFFRRSPRNISEFFSTSDLSCLQIQALQSSFLSWKKEVTRWQKMYFWTCHQASRHCQSIQICTQAQGSV